MKEQKGFSLIEILISVAILALLSLVVASIVFLVLRSSTKARSAKEVKQNGEGAARVIEELIRQAKTIENKESFCDGSDYQFLVLVDQEGKKTRLDCDLTSYQIASRSGEGFSRVVWLTNEEVVCANFNVNCQLSGEGYPLVTVSFNLSSKATYPRFSWEEFSTRVFLLEE